MFDHFLTSLLQIVIVLDILGAIVYLVLGGLKYKKRQALQADLDHRPLATAPLRKPFRQQSASRSSFAPWKGFFWSRPRPAAASQGDFDQLRRILYSYQEGLA